jgi:Zn-dependent protease
MLALQLALASPDDAGVWTRFLTWYIVFIIAITVHEAAHALVAWWGGDDTAYRGGQVSLNPIPHIRQEPFGTIIVPILSFFAAGIPIGWAKAPYNLAWARSHPLRQAAISAAGPLANLLLAVIILIALKVLLWTGVFQAPGHASAQHLVDAAGGSSWADPLAQILSILLSLNGLLFVFNLIPLPPLDGSGILEGLFPRSLGKTIEWISATPGISILAIVVAWRYCTPDLTGLLLKLLHPGHTYGP